MKYQDVELLNNTSKIAVILLNYNNNKDTVECVNSLLRGSIVPFIYIVDNNSKKKNIHTIFEGTKDLQVQYSKINLGFGNGNNIGINEVLSRECFEHILILNNDTVVEKDTLEILVNNLDEETAMTTCKINYFDEPEIVWYGGGEFNPYKGKPQICDFGKLANKEGANKEKFVSFASGCAMMFRADVLRQLGGFDTRFFMYVEDVELSLRVLKAGYKIKYIPSTRILHKVHGSTRKNNQETVTAFNPKNPNLSFHVYNITKNTFLMMYIHYKHTFTYYIFLAYHAAFIAFKSSLYLLKGRMDGIKAFIKAIQDQKIERTDFFYSRNT